MGPAAALMERAEPGVTSILKMLILAVMSKIEG